MIIIVDSREKFPYEFIGYKSIKKSLLSGDYSLLGHEASGIVIERKSLGDFISCCGKQRDRFVDELERMKYFKRKYLIIESTYQYLTKGNFGFTKMKVSSILGTLAKISVQYNVQTIFAGNWKLGEVFVTSVFNQYFEKFREGKI